VTVASFRAVEGTLQVLKDLLGSALSRTDGLGGPERDVRILGYRELKDPNQPGSESLGLYLHRISVDPLGRNRYLPPSRDDLPPQPELPVNLHLLLIGWTRTTGLEAALLGWAMQYIGSALDLDASHYGAVDPEWSEQERVQLLPEELSTEDLLRIWDGMPRDYMLSTPYVVKTLRLSPAVEVTAGPPVRSVTHVLERRE